MVQPLIQLRNSGVKILLRRSKPDQNNEHREQVRTDNPRQGRALSHLCTSISFHVRPCPLLPSRDFPAPCSFSTISWQGTLSCLIAKRASDRLDHLPQDTPHPISQNSPTCASSPSHRLTRQMTRPPRKEHWVDADLLLLRWHALPESSSQKVKTYHSTDI